MDAALDQQVQQKLDQLATTTEAATSWWSVNDAMTMCAAVLIFGLCVLLIASYLVKIGRASDDVLRILGTVLVVVSALFLVVAGYDDKQIAPVMGLLGSIMGYLLGKDASRREPPKDPSSK